MGGLICGQKLVIVTLSSSLHLSLNNLLPFFFANSQQPFTFSKNRSDHMFFASPIKPFLDLKLLTFIFTRSNCIITSWGLVQLQTDPLGFDFTI